MAELTDAEAAELCDLLSPWDPHASRADAFYHELVMTSRDVLDVGCGTGRMLHHARAAGHTGRLAGIDPDGEALDRARRRSDIEWLEGKAADATWDRDFDLAVMTGHAFQSFITNDEVRDSLASIRRALRPGGRFAFETRHPQARAWDSWASAVSEVTAPNGRTMRVSYDIGSVADGVVVLSEIFTDQDGTVLRADEGQLRFIDLEPLNGFLFDAGFAIDEQYGDLDRGPITGASEEIVTVARRLL